MEMSIPNPEKHDERDYEDVDLSDNAIGFKMVEASIQSCNGVTMAAVLEHNSELIAFVTPETCDTEAIMAEVATRPRDFRVRIHQVIALPSLPYTADGRVSHVLLRMFIQHQSVLNEKSLLSRLSSPPNVNVKEITASSGSSVISLPEYRQKSDANQSSEKQTNERGEDGGSWDGYLEAQLPEKRQPKHLRSFRHIAFIIYRRIFAVIFVANLIPYLMMIIRGATVPQIATATIGNLFAAIIIRQDHVINFLYVIAGLVPRHAPLAIRKQCAKVYHLGGIHSGCGVSATFWLLYLVVQATMDAFKPSTVDSSRKMVSIDTLGVTYAMMVLLIVILTTAYPAIRNKFHDKFEQFHRFSGWSALILLWTQIMLLTKDFVAPGEHFSTLLSKTPGFWMLILMTLSIASPWARLRKVRVVPEKLSDHAIRLHFDYRDRPVPGSFSRVSDRPLFEWHSFATVAVPDEAGFSMVVSKAGDWTSKYIANPPTSMWVRGVPTRGVMNVSSFFNRVIIVATGSGIGPCLPVLLAAKANNIAVRAVWSTPSPRATFGDEIVDGVLTADPEAIIFDTRKHGRPDLLKLVYQAYQNFDAEAVVIISNTPLTKKIVYGLEARGVNAYGAIWDS